MGLGLGLALATKYSGVLLAPALAVAVWLGDGPPRSVSRAALRFGAVVAVGGALLWLSYLPVNRSYSSEIGRDAIRAVCQNRSIKVVGRMRAHERRS
jgi:4-amino-4-deoxy-L-arabinose transferase-like glycosyltransferase